MIIEIHGTGTHNKGSELMLQATLQRLRASHPELQFATERWFGPYEDRAQYGLRTILPRYGNGRAWLLSAFMSKSFRQAFGLVNDSDLQGFVDASGYIYCDHWGTPHVERLAAQSDKWKRNGTPAVFLPQAFGPFTSNRIRTAARKLFQNASLVFARDDISLQHVRNLGVDGDHVSKAHDFTTVIPGEIPLKVRLPDRYGCVVPNVRMFDKASKREAEGYIDLLVMSIRRLQDCGIVPCFLFHEPRHDKRIAVEVQKELKTEVASFAFDCPIALKGIIGKASILIGSRFHALVGALCQSVPVIATSWSHKYEALLTEYGVSEFLITPNSGRQELNSLIDRVADDKERSRIVQLLDQRALMFKEQAELTFSRTIQVLGIS